MEEATRKKPTRRERRIERKIREAKKEEQQLAKYEEWKKRNEEEARNNRDPEKHRDFHAYQARKFEKFWNDAYSSHYGRFEDNTSIPCKRYTVNPAPYGGCQRDTLQVFSVKVTELTGGLQWPLDVFGMVALRDSLDQNRNIVFKRERGNCQTLTAEDPYLLLTGPVRGVVRGGPVTFEVSLYAKGTTESDDKELNLVASSMGKCWSHLWDSYLMTQSYTSRLSTLDFKLGHTASSVEATITVQAISVPRPDGFHGRFAAVAGLDEEFVLLDSQDENVPISGDEIRLSRRVATVEFSEMLEISVKAWQGGRVFRGGMHFAPREMGTDFQTIDIDFCKIKVTVDWSLFP